MIIAWRRDLHSFNGLLWTLAPPTLSCNEGERQAEKVNYVEFPRRGSSLSLCALNRKIIEVKIIDDEEYEKNKAFTIELGEPVLLEIGQKHGGCLGLFVCRTESLLRWISSQLSLCKQGETAIDCLKSSIQTQINLKDI